MSPARYTENENNSSILGVNKEKTYQGILTRINLLGLSTGTLVTYTESQLDKDYSKTYIPRYELLIPEHTSNKTISSLLDKVREKIGHQARPIQIYKRPKSYTISPELKILIEPLPRAYKNRLHSHQLR